MIETLHTVTLQSDRRFGCKIPPKAFGELLTVLPDAIRFSIRMAFESRSQARGKRPPWLVAASDIRFLGHEGRGDTVLQFSAPQLGEAAAELYKQQELWPTRPEPTNTGFDLLADVIQDVTANDVDSDRFDRRLLRQIEKFKRALNGTFQRISFTGSRVSPNTPAAITKEVIQSASRLCHNTPQSQQTRIVGKLDMIRSSTNSFAIKIQQGAEVRGVLTDGKISDFGDLLDERVLVLGRAVFRPSGSLLRVDARELLRAGGHEQFFSSLPKPRLSQFDLKEIVRGQQHKKGLPAVYGKWPGDESDEEIDAALREMH